MPRVLAVGSWNLNRGAGCGDAESSSNRTESDLVPESDSGSMNRDRGTAYRSLFPATMTQLACDGRGVVAAGSPRQQAHVLLARICSARADAGLHAVLLGGGLVPVCGWAESWNGRLPTVCQICSQAAGTPV